MHNIIDNLILINKEISAITSNTKIIAVSKTFPIEHIQPAIDHGHLHFGENKVQEAVEKWAKVKEKNSSLKIGRRRTKHRKTRWNCGSFRRGWVWLLELRFPRRPAGRAYWKQL